MSVTIQDFTGGAVTHRAARVSGGQMARAFDVGTWSKIRIAITYFFEDIGLGPAAGVRLGLGLQHGSDNMVGDETPAHFFGAMNYVDTGGTTRPYAYYNSTYGKMIYPSSASRGWTASTIVNGVITAVDTVYSQNCILVNDADNMQAGAFIDIEKSGTNYTMKQYVHRLYYRQAWTDAGYEAELVADPPTVPVAQAGPPTSSVMTVDEGTNGVFDHAVFIYDRIRPYIYINNFAVIRLA